MKRKTDGVFGRKLLTGGISICLAGMLCVFPASAAQPDSTRQTEEIQQNAEADTVTGQEQSGNQGQTDGQSGAAQEDQYKIQMKASALHYGQKLKESVLEGTITDQNGNPVPGTFSWSDPEKLMLTIGSGVQENVVFTPQMLNGQKSAAPKPICIWLTVEKGIVTVREWPVVTCRATVYDGDTLSEVTKLQGGTAVCIWNDEKKTEEKVEGWFVWEQPDLKLNAGSQSCKLVFKPYDGEKYLSAETKVEIEAEPRKVDLQLEASALWATEGEEITFDAVIKKTEKLTNVNGEIRFYVNDEEAAQQELEEAGDSWKAGFTWKADQKGSYRISARYIPADEHTAEEKSAEKKVTVEAPLTAIEEQELPDAREEKEYRISLRTDASGKFPVTFQVETGDLPKGLTLDEKKGILEGIPKEHGQFAFCIAASEKDVTVRRDFVLNVRKKLTFSIICNDICYGEKVSVSATVSPEEDFSYRQTFEGRGKTEYEESENAPVLPGVYRVRIIPEKPDDYAGEELVENFVIQKASPVLSVEAAPKELQGGGMCTLSVKLRNPKDSGLLDNLPADIAVSFDRDVKIVEALQGSDGDYTLAFETGEKEGTVRISVSAEENCCYEAASAYADVRVTKKKEEVKPPDNSSEDKRNDSSGRKEESEPEPVRKTPEEIEAEFWQDVVFRIYKAQESGDTVTINAKGHKSLPDKVLEALRQHEKVSLALVWEGDMIVIPAGKALPYDKEHRSWTLTELSEKYPLMKAEAVTPPAQGNAEAPVSSSAQNPGEAGSQNVKENKTAAPVQTAAANSGQESDDGKDGEGVQQPETEPESTEEESQKPVLEQLAEQEIPSAMEDVQEGSNVDWFLMAAGICAVCAIIVAAIALAALLKRKA